MKKLLIFGIVAVIAAVSAAPALARTISARGQFVLTDTCDVQVKGENGWTYFGHVNEGTQLYLIENGAREFIDLLGLRLLSIENAQVLVRGKTQDTDWVSSIEHDLGGGYYFSTSKNLKNCLMLYIELIK